MIIIHGKECWPSRGVATILEIGRNAMLKTLRAKGVLTRENSPCQAYCGKGYFVVERGQHNTSVTYYTPEGLEMVREICKDMPRKKVKPYIETELGRGLLEILNND